MTDEGDTMTSPLSEPSTCNNISDDANSLMNSGQSTGAQVCSSTTVPHAGCDLLTYCQLLPEAWRRQRHRNSISTEAYSTVCRHCKVVRHPW